MEELVIKKTLSRQLLQYITILEQEYCDVITKRNKNKLSYIKNNCEDSIKWNRGPAISLFADDTSIYFPLSSYPVLEHMKRLPQFGTQSQHLSCQIDRYLDNDYDFSHYIEHAILKGMTPLDYFQENLLHEVVHLCGGGGSSSLEEGLTELKTREVAQKYGLLTSGCGYPKEVKIAKKLQDMLGLEVINQIAFLGDNLKEVRNYLQKTCGEKVTTFYFQLREEMLKQSRFYKQQLDVITDPNKKQTVYDTIDYAKVHQMIDTFYLTKEKKH